MNNLVYLDNNATTRVDDRVMETMLPFFTMHYGNAASKHAFGWVAEVAVKKAREQVAAMIGAEPSEIVFTSGATEAVNTALTGIFRAYRSKGNHIITIKTEHKAVLDTCRYLEENEGAQITFLDVDKEGLIDLAELRKAIRPTTILIAVMAANNETGVLQPLEEIGELAKERKIIFFSDATAFAGKMLLNVNDLHVDCLALSAHKFHGPKGIGALYIRRRDPRVNVLPLLHGGGQEQGRRAGTLNVPLIAGLGKAAEIAASELWDVNTRLSKLRAYFEHHILDLPGLQINGSTRFRLYNTSNITFPQGYQGASELLKYYAFSSGSACSGINNEPSHVLKAMGLSDTEIRNSYRFSFSKYNTQQETEGLVKKIIGSGNEMRRSNE